MRWWEWTILLSLLVLGAAVRFDQLGKVGLSLNEIRDALIAEQPLTQLPAAVAQQTGTTPLPAILTHIAQHRWGRTETTARASAALFGSATILAVGLAGSVLFGAPALVGAALLALAPAHIAASREVQAAALAGLLVVGLVTCAWRVLQQPTWRKTLAFAAISTAAFYSHYGAVPVLAAILVVATVAAAFQRDIRPATGRLFAASLAALFAFAPWLWLDAQAGRGSVMYVPHITTDTFTGLVRAFTVDDRPVSPAWVIAVACAAAAGVARGVFEARLASSLVTMSVVATVATTLAVTYQLPHPFDPHQVLLLLPLYLLLAARGFEWPLQLIRPPARPYLRAAVALAIIVPNLLVLRGPAATPLPDWRTVAAVVGNNAWSDDAVAAPGAREALLFYAPGLLRQVLPEAPAGRLASALEHGVRGWLVAPLSVQLGGAWPELTGWINSGNVIDLSVGDDPLILYGGDTSRAMLLREIAGFDLPTAALARGRWLRDLLQQTGPVPAVFRLVDQLAAAEPGISLRNPELLNIVSLLVHSGHREQARGLAARIAEAEPDWLEAQQALVAVQSD
ncbi:MAG: glycosyltransferase family 39 protein [Deltaproteobacteria bacterium]|nr:glycosyltransferase family 39 protein [Deltaproteobacteria bacterium]MBI3390775.1 glycosyltransferase family 39 protein [Deltaproteobacteria bacterium]